MGRVPKGVGDRQRLATAHSSAAVRGAGGGIAHLVLRMPFPFLSAPFCPLCLTSVAFSPETAAQRTETRRPIAFRHLNVDNRNQTHPNTDSTFYRLGNPFSLTLFCS